MNWKSSLTGAVLVIIVGGAIGFAARGTKHTTTVTVTSAQSAASTVTVTTTVTATGDSGSGTGASTGTATASSSDTVTSPDGTVHPSETYYASYLATQTTGNNAQNAGLDSSPQTDELNGNTYPNAVAFDLSPQNGNTTESYQLPVPGFSEFSAPLAGLMTSESADASYKLTIYKNDDNPGAVVLYSNTFTGPSGLHPVRFLTHGATDILLVWSNTSNEPDNQDVFIFANPVVTSAK